MPAHNPDDYAIVVGINIYKHPDFQDLHGAVNDAKDFIKWLTDEQKLPNANIFHFFSDPDGNEPTLNQVYQCIKNLLDKSNGGEERIGRRVYIFLSGHGVGRDLDDTGLLAADHSRSMDSYLVGKMIADLFAKSAVFEQVVLFMDCCRDYDGELTAPYNPFRIKVDPDAHEVARCYCYGAKFNRQSHEVELEGDYHGIFTWSLLKGLRIPDEYGKVTASRLKKFVTNQIKKYDDDQEPQFPDSELILVDGLEPVFATVSIHLADNKADFTVLDSTSLKPINIKPKKIGDSAWEVELVPGKLYLFAIPKMGGGFSSASPVRVEVDGIFNENDEPIDHVEL